LHFPSPCDSTSVFFGEFRGFFASPFFPSWKEPNDVRILFDFSGYHLGLSFPEISGFSPPLISLVAFFPCIDVFEDQFRFGWPRRFSLPQACFFYTPDSCFTLFYDSASSCWFLPSPSSRSPAVLPSGCLRFFFGVFCFVVSNSFRRILMLPPFRLSDRFLSSIRRLNCGVVFFLRGLFAECFGCFFFRCFVGFFLVFYVERTLVGFFGPSSSF